MTVPPSSAERISYTFEWSAADNSAAGTTGSLEVRFGEAVLWPADFEWTWWELLEWLSQNWRALRAQDGLPVPVEALNAPHLFAAARLELDRFSDMRSEQLDEELWEFYESHDLDRALHGASRGPLLIWREGLQAVVVSQDHRFVTSWSEVERVLASMGDTLLERVLAYAVADEERWQPLVDAWRGRDRALTAVDLAAAAGRSSDEWAEITSALGFGDSWPSAVDQEHSAVERDELLVAARMSADLPVPVTVRILEELQRLPGGTTSLELDDVSRSVSTAVAESGEDRPYRQGYVAADVLRRMLRLDDHTPFDAARWLHTHEVILREARFGSPLIDALACWGVHKAPAVVINTIGRYSRSPGGRQASLAHEIGHLLLDREGALPAAEVFGGRVAKEVEQRARAFAAELLVPRDTAGRTMMRATAESADTVLHGAAQRMRTSRQLFAHQALNSDYPLSAAVRAELQLHSSPAGPA